MFVFNVPVFYSTILYQKFKDSLSIKQQWRFYLLIITSSFHESTFTYTLILSKSIPITIYGHITIDNNNNNPNNYIVDNYTL